MKSLSSNSHVTDKEHPDKLSLTRSEKGNEGGRERERKEAKPVMHAVISAT